MAISVVTMQDGNGFQEVERMQHLTTEFLIQFFKVRNSIQAADMSGNGFLRLPIFQMLTYMPLGSSLKVNYSYLESN